MSASGPARLGKTCARAKRNQHHIEGVRLGRHLLVTLVSLSAVGCNAAVVDEEPEGTSTSDTGGPVTGSTSGDTDDTDGWQTPTVDLGSEWEPVFGCDEPNARIPEGVECEDAIPGSEAPPEDQQAVEEAFGEECELERMCGGGWGVDCQALVDGPYYYVDPETLEVIATCGGACWVEVCEDCPPEGWSCPYL